MQATTVALALLSVALVPACVGTISTGEGDYASEDPAEEAGSEALTAAATCAPLMSVFPVVGDHNIGYDGSCNDGTCDTSCTGERANSDYGPHGDGTFHHGIDVFAHRGATLVAVAAGRVLYAKVDEVNGSHEVKIVDACGWSYFYGHLDTFAVQAGDTVAAGQPVGTMGNTGTGGVHLHFNASPGGYSDDVNPLELLKGAEASACTGEATPPAPADPGCGRLNPNDFLDATQSKLSCSGNYILKMQEDGNLVLYPTSNQGFGGAVWDSHTFGPNQSVVMQTDGNLVIYPNGSNRAVWDSHTNGQPGAYLEIGDGVLTLHSAYGSTLWTSR